MPDDVEFATKNDMVQAMLERALDAGVPASWVTMDEAYGQSNHLRSGWRRPHPVRSESPHLPA